jgi:hypothetical protein
MLLAVGTALTVGLGSGSAALAKAHAGSSARWHAASPAGSPHSVAPAPEHAAQWSAGHGTGRSSTSAHAAGHKIA